MHWVDPIDKQNEMDFLNVESLHGEVGNLKFKFRSYVFTTMN